MRAKEWRQRNEGKIRLDRNTGGVRKGALLARFSLVESG